MAKGVNKVILVGACGQDPEVRYSQNGTAFANVSIATNESWTDKQSGEKREHTEWHRLVFSARIAEVVGEYVKKGMTIYIEGKLSTRKWQDQSGQDRYTTEIKCFEMQMLGGQQGQQSNQSGQGGVGSHGGYGQQSAQQPAPQQSYNQPQQTHRAAPSSYANVPHATQQSAYQQPKPNYQGQQTPNRSQPAPPVDSFDDD